MIVPFEDLHKPGFNYTPHFEASSLVKKSVSHSFRTGNSKNNLSGLTGDGTPLNVGPNSYNPDYKALNEIKGIVNQKFGTAKRNLQEINGDRYFDTYVDYSSMGIQVASKKKTEREISLGKANKNTSFTGIMDRKVLKVALKHANY